MPPLKEGDIYLSISLLGKLNIVAFKNDKKKTDNDPDYVGNGIAIWKKTKMSPKPVEEKISEEDI